jgi:hypothetical protein
MKPLYAECASLLIAMRNCEQSNNTEWLAKHGDRLQTIVRRYMPSGSGFDNGTAIDMDRSNPARLVFCVAFHHMDTYGCYDGWTEHVVTVRACLAFGFTLTVSGRDRNGIKDYIADAFRDALQQDVDVYA